MRKNKLSQTMIEYSILIGLVTFSLIAMNIYLKRSFQGKYRQTADQIAWQYDPLHTRGVSKTTTNTTSHESTTAEGISVTVSDINQTLYKNETVEGWF